MPIGTKTLTSILFTVFSCVVLAAAPELPHEEFMPVDVQGSRQDKPDQMLLQIDNYRITLASEARGGIVPAQDSSVWLFIEGRTLIKGSALRNARIGFVDGGAPARPARVEKDAKTLVIYYPLSYLEPLTGLLNGPGPHFVQARFYGNGTVWADIHAGPVRVGH